MQDVHVGPSRNVIDWMLRFSKKSKKNTTVLRTTGIMVLPVVLYNVVYGTMQ